VEHEEEGAQAGAAGVASTPMSRFLITAAVVVALAWGTRAAVPVLTPFLLAVVVGPIVVNTVVDKVVKPLVVKKGTDVSLLLLVASLVVWTLLLGSTGAILAIPLTMATRKFIRQPIEAGHRLGPVGRECPG